MKQNKKLKAFNFWIKNTHEVSNVKMINVLISTTFDWKNVQIKNCEFV